jgi:hypothetical protein
MLFGRSGPDSIGIRTETRLIVMDSRKTVEHPERVKPKDGGPKKTG